MCVVSIIWMLNKYVCIFHIVNSNGNAVAFVYVVHVMGSTRIHLGLALSQIPKVCLSLSSRWQHKECQKVH